MTRDEARPIAKAIVQMFLPGVTGDYRQHTEFLIDKFEMLGMLKIDKGPNERAVDAMFSRAYATSGGGMITPRHAVDAISEAGLKIVEK